jgi:hypothetical protein
MALLGQVWALHPQRLLLMVELKIWEELHHQSVDQMIYTPISFSFEPYAL